jgi:glycosyltransferase involved in cell wall biosynthesis
VHPRLRGVAWSSHDRLRDWSWRHAASLRSRRAPDYQRDDPRRVLHVTSSFDLGGTQTQLKHLCTAGSSRYAHSAVEIFPELNYMFRQDATIDRERYATGGLLAGVVGPMVADRSKRASHFVQAYKLSRDFEAERPSVVAGWGHEISAVTFVAAAIARVPHVVFCIRTVNPDFGWTSPDFAALLLDAHQEMTPLVSKVIVNSTFLRSDHAQWVGMPEEGIDVCANGIAVDRAADADRAGARKQFRDRLGVDERTVLITNVGRFSPEKGQLSLIDAQQRMAASGLPPFAWLLCGDGPTLPLMQAEAARLGITNMFFPGRMPDVRSVLAASDVFVMPSDFEGMPNAMMEAMAAGLPCVSTTRSGIRDVARDGIEALYYEPGDTATLARELSTLVADPSRARALGAAAAERITAFDVPRFVECFNHILDALPSRG